MKFLNKIDIYRLIAFLSAIIFLIDGFLNNKISSLLVVDALKIKDNLELWRFVTFPLAYVTLANAFIGFSALFFFAPKLRHQLNRKIFDLSMLLLTFVVGLILFMLNFSSPQIPVMGIEAISAYIITLYIFVNRRKDIRYFKTVRLTRMAYPLFLLASWAMLFLLENDTSKLNSHLIDQSPAIFGIGIFMGLIGYFMLRDEKSEIRKINQTPVYGLREIRDLEPTPAIIEKYTSNELKSSSNNEDAIMYSDEDPESNEEILNDILEHINKSGYDSLKEEEKTFLKIYAKSL